MCARGTVRILSQYKGVYCPWLCSCNFSSKCISFVAIYIGVPQDLSKALSIFETACEKGSSGACNNAGLVWKTSRPDVGGVGGVGADHSRAADFFHRACNGGHKNGCFNLSALYLQGSNQVPKSMQRALEFSLQSCELGHPYGCANAARMYLLGDGVEADRGKSEELKKKAKKLMNS